MMRTFGWRWMAVGWVALTLGCTRDNPVFGDTEATDGKDTAPTGGTVTDGPVDGSGAGTLGASGTGNVDTLEPDSGIEPTTSPITTGPDPTGDSCPPATDGIYGACLMGDCGGGECVLGQSEGPVAYEVSVCTQECTEACPCPPPTSGTAEPMCHNGVCSLGCGGANTQCPEGMVCSGDVVPMCVHPHAYGPCDETCQGACVDYLPGFTLCAPEGCFDRVGGVLDSGLCPPGSSGTAQPQCTFLPSDPAAPDLLACALVCEAGETCPPEMVCQDGLCMHPAP